MKGRKPYLGGTVVRPVRTVYHEAMSRKIRLTPLQRDILWLLEEAGEETVSTAIASVRPLDRETFDKAVKGLVQLGYVIQLETPEDPRGSIILTQTGRRGLTI